MPRRGRRFGRRRRRRGGRGRGMWFLCCLGGAGAVHPGHVAPPDPIAARQAQQTHINQMIQSSRNMQPEELASSLANQEMSLKQLDGMQGVPQAEEARNYLLVQMKAFEAAGHRFPSYPMGVPEPSGSSTQPEGANQPAVYIPASESDQQHSSIGQTQYSQFAQPLSGFDFSSSQFSQNPQTTT